MKDEMTIRLAEQSDEASIAKLLGRLGYPSELQEVRARITRLSALSSERVLVAEHEGDVVGVVSIHLAPMLHASGSVGWITALVVSEDHRGLGIGTRLMQEAEAWAWSQDCVKTEVTSGDHRADAHRFYESQGYHCDTRRFLKMNSKRSTTSG